MDIATVVGVLAFLGLLAFTAMHAGGGVKVFALFINMEAILVVMGGTFCALLVNYPLKQVLGTFKIFMKVLFSQEEDASESVVTFVQLSAKARQRGILSLEEDLKRLNDDFMKRGVQLVIDGHDQEFVKNMLETEIDFIRERHKLGREIFNSLGVYSPAFGIIGTVFGMILMLNSIDNVAEVPKKMAVALAAAFIGLGTGYLLFLPMAGKLGRRSEEELFVKEIIIRGVLLLQNGVSPMVMENNLKAYLEPSKCALLKKAPAPAGPPTPAPAPPA